MIGSVQYTLYNFYVAAPYYPWCPPSLCPLNILLSEWCIIRGAGHHTASRGRSIMSSALWSIYWHSLQCAVGYIYTGKPVLSAANSQLCFIKSISSSLHVLSLRRRWQGWSLMSPPTVCNKPPAWAPWSIMHWTASLQSTREDIVTLGQQVGRIDISDSFSW